MPLGLMLTRPCAGHRGRATRRPFSYRSREDAVGKGAWDKDNGGPGPGSRQGWPCISGIGAGSAVSYLQGLYKPDRWVCPTMRTGIEEPLSGLGVWGPGRWAEARTMTLCPLISEILRLKTCTLTALT